MEHMQEETVHAHAGAIAAILSQLANENRLLIVCTLLEGPKTVKEIAASVPGITAPALSQHLHKLKDANLVCTRKHAQFVVYSICDKRIRHLMDVLKEEFCK